jgi:hypothetical protein
VNGYAALPTGHRILRRVKFLEATIPRASQGQREEYSGAIARAVEKPLLRRRNRPPVAGDGTGSGVA